MLEMAATLLRILDSALSLGILKQETKLKKEFAEIQAGLREITANYNEVDFEKMDMALFDNYLFRLRLLSISVADALRAHSDI